MTTTTEWANPEPSSGSYVREKASRIRTEYVDAEGTVRVLSDKTLRYDDQVAGGLPHGLVSTGSVHTVESYLDASLTDPAVPPAEPARPVVVTWHDDFGNVTATQDPEGNLRVSVFDPSLFSLHATEELLPNPNEHHAVLIETDLRYGKPVRVTDENAQVTEYSYDSLGRLECEALPGDSIAGCGQGGVFSSTHEYQYVHGTPGAAEVSDRLSKLVAFRHEVNHPNGYAVSKAYVDALGRQRFVEVEQVVDGALTMVVREQVEYDSAGRISKKYPPYADLLENVVSLGALAKIGRHAYLREGFSMAARASRALKARYDTPVSLAGERLARFLEMLAASSLLEDAVVIVTSDHGEAFGEHDLYFHDASAYNTHLHVPLWIHHPEVPPGICRDVVSLRSVFDLIHRVCLRGTGSGSPGAEPRANRLQGSGR